MLALAGCGGTSLPIQLRLDQNSFVFYGYYLDSEEAVDLIVEEIRFAPEVHGSIIFDVAVLNRRQTPVKVDFGAAQLEIGNRRLLPQQPRSVVLLPHKLERATLSFRTNYSEGEVDHGALRFPGVTLNTGQKIRPFVAPFHRSSREELGRELGVSGDELP
ncbi:hypothetical protein ACFL59_15335 [Planctomycetota bacterium]